MLVFSFSPRRQAVICTSMLKNKILFFGFAFCFLTLCSPHSYAAERFKNEKQVIAMGLGTAYALHIDEKDCLLVLARKEELYVLPIKGLDVSQTSFKRRGLVADLEFFSNENTDIIHFELEGGKPKSRQNIKILKLLTTTVLLDIFDDRYEKKYNKKYPYEDQLRYNLAKIKKEC